MPGHEEFGLSDINGSNVHHFATQEALFDRGEDSRVFDLGKYILKEYRKLPIEKIQLYDELTQAAALLAPRYSELLDEYGITTLAAEPIQKVIKSDQTGWVYTLSRFDRGERGREGMNPKLDNLLEKFTIDLRQNTRYAGILVIASNTRLSQGSPTSVCNITDICRRISELRRF